uniref:Uncharacterized protein n=1 Tax=Arundo donax TaxID=35708 RepID=A0A0A9BH30_ARUDO
MMYIKVYFELWSIFSRHYYVNR